MLTTGNNIGEAKEFGLLVTRRKGKIYIRYEGLEI